MDHDDKSPEVSMAARGQAPAKHPARSSVFDKAISRRNSREWALQILFNLDVTPPETSLDDVFAHFWEFQKDVIGENQETGAAAVEEFERKANRQYRLFAEKLVRGVWLSRDEIDTKIEGYLENWTISRMGGVDRNVLRIAFWELFFNEDTPPIVVINEAIDIAKYFSTRESGKFVNGVLDRASRDISRPLREKAKRRGK